MAYVINLDSYPILSRIVWHLSRQRRENWWYCFNCTWADPERGRWSGPPTPLKNHKNIGFLSNTGPDTLKITKLSSQHSMLGHHLHASKTPFTVMSPNIARPLTLRTSPSDYAKFNQIKSFLIFSIRLLLEREKQQKVSILSFRC